MTPAACGTTDKEQRQARQLRPYLESLPAEIIQKIFFHCVEINLPRASISIARTLSSPLIYKWIIRLAFSNDNQGSEHGFFTEDFLPSPLDFYNLSLSERTALQSAVLECRWCTLSLMRKCQEEYLQHVLRRKCQYLIFSPEDMPLLDSSMLARAFQARVRHNYHRADFCMPMTYHAKANFYLSVKTPPPSNANLKLAIWFHFGLLHIFDSGTSSYGTEHLYRLPSSGSAVGELPFRMPDKLLRPPWTADKLEFLHLLSYDAYVDDDESSRRRSKRVLHQVIRDRDFDAFEKLLRMRIRMRWYQYPVAWPVMPSHLRAIVKYAKVEQGGKDDPFAKLLVLTRWDDVAEIDLKLKYTLLSLCGAGDH